MQNLDLKGLPRLDLEALAAEREYSDERWTLGFDANNTLNDWITYICMYATSAGQQTLANYPDQIYEKLIKAANLALLAAEHVRTGQRAPRHYDPEELGEVEVLGFERQSLVRYRGITNDDPPVIRPGGDGIFNANLKDNCK